MDGWVKGNEAYYENPVASALKERKNWKGRCEKEREGRR